MKRFKQFLAVFLATMMCVTTVVPVHAATPVTQDGITMTVTPDKTEYSQNETITATVKVENTNNFTVTDVSLEGITPEGYELEIGNSESLTVGELEAHASKELTVSFVPKEPQKVTVYYRENFDYEGENPDWLHENWGKASDVYVYNGGDYLCTATAVTSGDNTSLKVKASDSMYRVEPRWSPKTSYSDAGATRDLSDKTVVYQFDINLSTVGTLLVNLRSQNGGTKYSRICEINNNKLSFQGVSETYSLTDDVLYNIAVINDYKKGTQDIYLNRTLIVDDNPIHNYSNLNTSAMNDFIRFHSDSKTTAEFTLDNVLVYESDVLREISFDEEYEDSEVEEPEVVITIDPNKSVFNEEKYDTDEFEDALANYVSLHTRNGLVYKGDTKTKTKLATTPLKAEGGYLVVLEEIAKALGLNYSVSNGKATVNGKEVSVTEKNGKQWVDAAEFLGIYGVVSIDTNETVKSSGMMIAGPSAFSWPSADVTGTSVFTSRSELQNLNDYLFFERPTTTQITALYNDSELKEAHPRIMATAADFARIKEEVKTDSLMNEWYQKLMVVADYLVEEDTDPVIWELTDGVRLLSVSRDVASKMYTLGMAYQLTGDKKYVERAWVDLEAVSKFKDWHPEHDIDCSEMAAGVSIGYDWMYDALTEGQREIIEYGMYKNCFAVVVESYESSSGVLGANPVCLINHNIVLNGGFTMGAVALMDVYPEIAAHITSMTVRAADLMLVEFGPDGAWKEGPHYWEYTAQFTSKMLSTLETVFGTCFSLDACEGLESTANYILNLQSDMGIFNYGDGTQANYYVPELFYLSNKYGDSSVTSTTLELGEGKMLNEEDVALALLWYNTDIKAESTSMELDAAYWTEGVATFRDVWTSGATTFVGIHGGPTRVCHAQVDGGTFVYDYAGIRWAKELGSTPYDVNGVTADYAVGGKRWLLYRSKAEAHNTIVINPDTSSGQKEDSTARLTDFKTKAKGGIAVLDLSENYSDNASKAVRGFFFTDDRTSLVVRDEISLKEKEGGSTVYWFMQTDASVEIAEDGKSAIMTQSGKQVRLDFVTEGNATLSVGPSTRALLGSTSPATGTAEANEDTEDPGVNRIAIQVTGASDDIAITVKLTPVGVNSTPISDYNKSISSWEIPDGEVAVKPEVQSVVIDGRELKFDSANQAAFLCVEGKYDSVPEAIVTVDESKFSYEVTQATTTKGGVATIVVRDKENAEVSVIYTVKYDEIPVASVPNEERFANMTALQIINAEASEAPEADQGHVAWKTLDQDKSTRWTSQGIGQWILYELEEEATVDNLLILFKNGHKRSTYFNVSVSTDGENFQQIWSGKSAGTELGDSEAYEQIALGGVSAKYIKIGCNGNSAQGLAGGWNNIGEVVFTGTITPTIKMENTDTSYTKSSGETAVIYCTGIHTELVDVYVNDEKIDETNYTVKAGSTIVEFKNEYLESLPVGTYTVKLLYTNNRTVTSVLKIIEDPTVSPGPSTQPGATPTPGPSTQSDATPTPQPSTTPETDDSNDSGIDGAQDTTKVEKVSGQTNTGDSSHMLLWSVLLVISLGVVVVIGIIYRKKLKGKLPMLLACALVTGMFANVMQVCAEETSVSNRKTLTATETVRVGETNVTIGFNLTYTFISFEEDFDAEGFKKINWSGTGATRGIAINFADSGYEITADENNSNDKELSILGTVSGNVDARFSDDASWADATSTSDLTKKKLVYEFDLKIKENNTANFNVLLRSVSSSTKMSKLCVLENNVLKLENATETKTLTAGEYKIAIACDFTTGKQDVYVNGSALAKNVDMHNIDAFNEAQVNDLLRFEVKTGSAYAFALDNIKVCEGEYTGEIIDTPTPVITIDTQPTAAEVNVGEKAALTVAATATESAAVTYQWYKCDDADKTNAEAIEGETDATYEVTPAVVGTSYYYCKVSAGAESVDSEVVTVMAKPVVLYAEDFSYEGETPDWLVTSKDFYGVYNVSGTEYTATVSAGDVSGNKVLNVNAANTKYQVNVRWSKNTESKSKWEDNTNLVDLTQKTIVYEFDISPVESSKVNVNLRSYNSGTKLSKICGINNNVLEFTGVTETMSLENGKWYHIAVVNDYTNGLRDIYVDNLSDSTVETWKVTDNEIPNYANLNTAAMNDFMRFHYDSAATAKFMLDNIRVYEAEAPYDFE